MPIHLLRYGQRKSLSSIQGSDGKCGSSEFDPGSGRSPGEGNGNPLHSSCLENPMDRGAWWATAHGIAESNTAERLTLLQKYKRWALYINMGKLKLEDLGRSGILFYSFYPICDAKHKNT